MLIARAPVRISLAGGGTDLPAYYERHGGFVLSTTIDKYFYVLVSLTSADSIQISSSDYRVFYRQRPGEAPLWDGDLGLVKAALHLFGLERGLSLFLASEVPPGTGLGSSSAVAVALVKAMAALGGRLLSPAEVAARACSLELEELSSPIGKQDQYAASFGGLNAITFATDSVAVESLVLPRNTRDALERNLLLFFTGATRQANAILARQQRASVDDQGATVGALHAIKRAAKEAKHVLEQGQVRCFGEILAELWEYKKKLAAGVSNPRIDELYALARRHGAIGGKLAGAGGGGFLLLYCEESYQAPVTRALEEAGLYRMDYRFEHGGAQVLLNALPGPTHPWSNTQQRELSHA